MYKTSEIISAICAKPDVIACELDEGAALLDLSSSTYYSMNPVGAHVWNLIQRPSTIDEICRSVASVYSVAEDVCQADIRQLIDQFLAAKLVTTAHVT